MGEKISVEAIYEDGVLKPLTPLNLAEKQTVRLEIAVEQDAAQPERNIVKLGGIWAQYFVGEELSYGS
jgi:predicted DNA-binding antitoxin AbrB/MazE fold protein